MFLRTEGYIQANKPLPFLGLSGSLQFLQKVDTFFKRPKNPHLALRQYGLDIKRGFLGPAKSSDVEDVERENIASSADVSAVTS
jgi:hypothetical protein